MSCLTVDNYDNYVSFLIFLWTYILKAAVFFMSVLIVIFFTL